TAVTVRLDLANNDFSQGLSGWTVGTSTAYTVDHAEASQPLIACPDCVVRPPGDEALLTTGGPAAIETEMGVAATTRMASDWDLALDTKNRLGAQSAMRRFRVAPGTTDVSVRYRFQSDERRIGQEQGIYRDDWYEVVVRSLATGTQVRDAQTVTTLWSYFDGNQVSRYRGRVDGRGWRDRGFRGNQWARANR
ncbi:MAG: hypothetical protein H0W08_27495, partial [Acidobacteria bacterium]|nr:hypothetical protein [Acidobacteriota bacterium]